MASVIHEPWCEGHDDDPLLCTYTAPPFGSVMTDSTGESYPRGSLFVRQGDEDEQPEVGVEYCNDRTRLLGHVLMPAAAALVLLEAFKDSPEETVKTLSAALEHVENSGGAA